jgi:hypothetical protein
MKRINLEALYSHSPKSFTGLCGFDLVWVCESIFSKSKVFPVQRSFRNTDIIQSQKAVKQTN